MAFSGFSPQSTKSKLLETQRSKKIMVVVKQPAAVTCPWLVTWQLTECILRGLELHFLLCSGQHNERLAYADDDEESSQRRFHQWPLEATNPSREHRKQFSPPSFVLPFANEGTSKNVATPISHQTIGPKTKRPHKTFIWLLHFETAAVKYDGNYIFFQLPDTERSQSKSARDDALASKAL